MFRVENRILASKHVRAQGPTKTIADVTGCTHLASVGLFSYFICIYTISHNV